MKNCAAPLVILVFCLTLAAGEADSAPRVPDKVAAALATLPPDARPQVVQAAKNGAIYVMLPNGCEIILMEKHNAPVVAVQGWVRTGAMHENKWMGAGLSHFCEHMLFKGTTKRPTGVLDQEIRGAGGDDNAYTNSERTVYHITGAREGFDTAFNALADMLMDSTFPPEETVKEHAVVVKEIERYMDNPDSVLWEAFERTVYQEHPYRVPVLGYPDRFKRVTREDVFGYYQQRYSPHLTAFVAVGDFDIAMALPEMAKTLAQWKRKSVEPVVIPEEPEQVAPRSVEITHPLCEVPKLMVGFPTVSLRHPDLYALDILANVLGDGRSSRLYRTVKDKLGLALEVSAFSYTPQYAGWFGISATVENDKIADARAAILKVIEEARTKKPSEEELARARRKVYTQHVFSQMTADGLAGDLGANWFVAGDLDFSEHYTERMQQVTADDVLRVARKYLTPEKLNAGLMLPAEKEAAKPAEPAPKAVAPPAAADGLQGELERLRANPAVEKASLLADKAVFELTLKNSGLRIVVRQDASLPVVNAAVAALGGTRWEPAELAGAGNLLAEMLDRGTAKRDKLKLAEEVEDLGARLSAFSGRNSFGVSIGGLKQDAQKLMELAADSILRPSFSKEELEKLKADTLQQIAQEDESLFTLNSKLLRPLLYGTHPYARQTLGTPETIAKVTVEDLKKLHEAWIQPENLAIGFVGDITPQQAVELSTQFFGALRPGKFAAPAVPAIAELAPGKNAELARAEITGAILTLGFRGVNLKSPDREALDLLAALLSGLGGRLNVNLREKQGLAYSVGVYNDAQFDGGAVVFYIQTDAQSLDKALAGMWDEVKKLRDEAPQARELESVKAYMAGTEAIELQNQSELAQRLALSQLYEEGAAHVFGRRARLDKVTVENLRQVAQKYLDLQRWAKAVVKPK